jgi:hypothetical protein
MTGFFTFALRKPCKTRPGIAPDVRPAVPAHLGLVAHAAERDPHVGAAGRVGDRLAERGLAYAGRAHQAEDRAALALRELAHGHVLEDALLHVAEAGVVLVELVGDAVDVFVDGGASAPRQRGDPLEVGLDDRGLGALSAGAFEARELSLHDLARLVGEAGLVELVPELAGLVSLVVAELAPDRAELLPQQVLALILADLAAHVLADLLAELAQLPLFEDEAEDLAHPLLHVERHQHLERRGGLEAEQTGDPIRERAWPIDEAQGVLDLGGPRALLAERGLELLGEDLRLLVGAALVGELGALDLEERLVAGHPIDGEAAQALDGDAERVGARHPDDLRQPRDGAHGVKVCGDRLFDLGVALGDDAEERARLQALDEGEAARATDGEREAPLRQQNAGAQREQGKRRLGERALGHGRCSSR